VHWGLGLIIIVGKKSFESTVSLQPHNNSTVFGELQATVVENRQYCYKKAQATVADLMFFSAPWYVVTGADRFHVPS